ncbi:type III secretion system gatekeeper subunit SctW [Serratia symbiotica]|uniref:type III secretion system gatekeeper subunit SctW n=1 Tax=Serratia symbiotica TaxID=138074 RepID=UPI00132BC407|nr:type III secretion system gatekeeper subunit SctW [Serratia symbiotica]MBF1996213.1 type III secretion system gatekeeper subunit SctW [Serratia symbiotica]MBQ0954636.1 type III secretion system gatekeeper subunit SctW [Serratia symbiotica]QTP14078.1 type III secretion system gatekeeper subunit SctW [Serratia symbiotica]
MAIIPVGGSARFIVGQRDKSAPAAKAEDDSDKVAQGQGVINNNNEYASMAMLAASHVRRRGSQVNAQEEWMKFAERILDSQADEKILHVEDALSQQLMNPRQIRACLLQFFADPSDILMVLAALIQRRRLNEKQLERLKELQKQLQAEDLDRSAEAGINIALVAKAFAQKTQRTAGNLRMLYREFLRHDGPVVYLYEQWAEEQAPHEHENILRFLTRALAYDLQVLPLGHSNINEFSHFFNRISRLRETQSVERVFRQHFQHAGFDFINQSGEKAFSKLFTRGIRSHKSFNDYLLVFFSEHLSVLSIDRCARFLQILIVAFSTLPTGIFLSPEGRDSLINELKEYMGHVLVQELEIARRKLSEGN